MSAFRPGYLFTAIITLAAATTIAHAAGPPTRIGGCTKTNVKRITTRLVDTPGSGSAVYLTNGGFQVSYDTVPSVDGSRPGDPVRMCLVWMPKDCPPGDDRGKVYKTTNLRTNRSWELPDSHHQCGGA